MSRDDSIIFFDETLERIHQYLSRFLTTGTHPLVVPQDGEPPQDRFQAHRNSHRVSGMNHRQVRDLDVTFTRRPVSDLVPRDYRDTVTASN